MTVLVFHNQAIRADQQVCMLLETDKCVYTLGENVTITLTNNGSERVDIGGYPAWQIFTYPGEEPVYPAIFASLAWYLDPGENDTFVWNQYNEFNQSSVRSGAYIVMDTQGWGLSAHFEIIAAEIIVPDDYPTIQEAINAASPGDTIFVRAGTYYENVVVNKTVSLIGENENNTVINGSYMYRSSVVLMTADCVQISGFTIQNGWCGIAVHSSNGCVITENRIMNNAYRGGGPEIVESGRGVWLVDSENCTVAKNALDSNDRNVSLEEANDNIIMNNTITNSLISWGIVLESSHNNSIGNNVVRRSVYDGIYLAFANNNNIFANYVMNNRDEGIYIGSSENNVVIRNIVMNNSGEGIWLDGSNDSTVIGNTFMNNRKRGVLVWHSARTIVYHNNFVNNSWGQAYSNLVNSWDSGYPSGGNYWSDYNDTDLYSGPYQNMTGSDGIGDMPYVIDENNTDRYPLMKPYPWGPDDVGITSLTTSKTVVGQGYNLSINMMLFNYGNNTENFNITVHANATIIGTFENITLTSRNSTTVTLTLNTTSLDYGNYTMWAYAEPVPNETDITDNTYLYGTIIITIKGDVDGDFEVDIYDIVKICIAYGSKEGDPKYVPECDINCDRKIDIYDVVIACIHLPRKQRLL